MSITFRRVGNMTYDVIRDGRTVGTVWRTRSGWSAALRNGLIVVEDYRGSRAVAALNLAREAA